MSAPMLQLSDRDRAIMRAILGADRAVLTVSCEPDLDIDGCHCGDQAAVHRLCRAGLIGPAAAGRTGDLVPAQLTPAGVAALQGGAR
ncbi:MAG TPA: hypothetical protein VG674_32025 [Amycolatopsis sp.]|nr:hypothetical protein [Amycolatopsis sp.]